MEKTLDTANKIAYFETELSYIKNPKDPSVLTGTFLLKNNTLTDIPNIAFTAEKDQVQIKGKASFKNGTFFHFDTIKAPRNDASVLFKRDQNDLVTFEVKGKRLYLACADGVFEVTELKPDGKRAMEAAAWAAGLRERMGTWERLA